MMRTTTFETHTLAVPGANLYYEERGSGPVLLLMPGGPADATTFRRIEDTLAERHTVVTYDPRGLSHSTLEQPLDDSRMVEVFADDVHRLLERVAGDARACVFASSGGASIVLELCARHPEQLDTVVAHEPPTPALMRDAAAVRAGMEDVCDTCARDGVFSAAQKFMKLVGVDAPPPAAPEGEHGKPSEAQLEAQALMQKNMEFFFGRYIRNIARYEPDLEALRSCACRIVPAVGEDSRGQLAHNGGLGLATRLGTRAEVFPGDHGGFDGRPDEFAAKLLEVLDAR